MRNDKYGSRVCIICGCTYIPGRKDQKTCGSKECMKERQRLNYLEYRQKNYERVLENNRRQLREKREAKRRAAAMKEDTIVAIGYAERQVQRSLAMAGKVKVEL